MVGITGIVSAKTLGGRMGRPREGSRKAPLDTGLGNRDSEDQISSRPVTDLDLRTVTAMQQSQPKDVALRLVEDFEEDSEDDLARRVSSKTFEGRIDLRQLVQLKQSFDDAAASTPGCPGELTEDEFVTAFSKIMKGRMTNAELSLWFMKIDANANGSIDWDEFSTYLLLEGEQAKSQEIARTEYIPLAVPQKPREHLHSDMISRMLVHPRTGKYYSFSRDGSAKIWSATTSAMERIFHIGTSWVTDACWLKNQSKILLSTMDRKFYIYEAQSGELKRSYVGQKYRATLRPAVTVTSRGVTMSKLRTGISDDDDEETGFQQFQQNLKKFQEEPSSVEAIVLKGMEDCATAVQYCDSAGAHRDLMVTGLRSGTLLAYPLTTSSSGLVPTVTTQGLHDDQISRILMTNFLGGVLTSSWDTTIKLTNLEANCVLRTLGGAMNSKGPQKGIVGMDWSEETKLISSVGGDRIVYIWNPFIGNPVFKLEGHTAPLVDCAFNDYQLVTLAMDKIVKVWDVRTFGCMQTFLDPNLYYPENSLTALAYDRKRQRIVAGATHPEVWCMRRHVEATTQQNFSGHSKPIVGILYNPNFDQIISADGDTIIVWDVDSGQRVHTFHVRQYLADDDDAITSVDFDVSCRRLMTGMRCGSVLVWNYINGQPLKELSATLKAEVSVCCHVVNVRQNLRQVCVASGHKVCTFEDGEKAFKERVKHSFQFNKEAVTAMVQCDTSVLAYAIEGGEIIVYSVVMNKKEAVLGKPQSLVTVDSLLYLQHKDSILIAARSDGYLQLWNVKARSLLFSWAPSNEYSMCYVAANSDNNLLAAADELGVLRIWDISAVPRHPHVINAMMIKEKGCFRAHEQPIKGIIFVDKMKCIVTVSMDRTVKMFTLDGVYLGYFGQSNPWDLSQQETWSQAVLPLPPDIPVSPGAHDASFWITSSADLGQQSPSLPASRDPKCYLSDIGIGSASATFPPHQPVGNRLTGPPAGTRKNPPFGRRHLPKDDPGRAKGFSSSVPPSPWPQPLSPKSPKQFFEPLCPHLLAPKPVPLHEPAEQASTIFPYRRPELIKDIVKPTTPIVIELYSPAGMPSTSLGEGVSPRRIKQLPTLSGDALLPFAMGNAIGSYATIPIAGIQNADRADRVGSAMNKSHLRARPPSKPGSAHQRATATVHEPPKLHFEPSAPSLAALEQKIELLQSFQDQGIESVIHTSPARAKGRV
uniref:EF-hand domain-containing protein n=1 Tax=Eutreptiella gymnastica TaxID=73025 RepID=A0A7S1IYZ1_9EUGL|mmetsp:Transcript_54241/g.96435  ORF Transcript_54241/g.96435 Transcript_54241/m.96435 type:complete len:1209 (+) Transcript_54241:115-3741(+)